MLELRRSIFALLLAVVYITASLFSSLSVITCDGHHCHTVELCSHDESCGCGEPAFEQDCCCHDHSTLEEAQGYCAVDVQQRGDTRYAVLQLLNLVSDAIPTISSGISDCFVAYLPRSGGDEAAPLQTAYISSRALRAPPVLA
ncbi:MAG: hypothetical protein J6R81_05570 [Alistipes sp.]|nr:hypothetical protein [Alistipes sp.]